MLWQAAIHSLVTWDDMTSNHTLPCDMRWYDKLPYTPMWHEMIWQAAIHSHVTWDDMTSYHTLPCDMRWYDKLPYTPLWPPPLPDEHGLKKICSCRITPCDLHREAPTQISNVTLILTLIITLTLTLTLKGLTITLVYRLRGLKKKYETRQRD